MSKNQENKRNHRNENITREIEDIQTVALTAVGDNGVAFEMTFAQASSIRFRAQQLIRESVSGPVISPKIIAKQIDICWKLHEQGRA